MPRALNQRFSLLEAGIRSNLAILNPSTYVWQQREETGAAFLGLSLFYTKIGHLLYILCTVFTIYIVYNTYTVYVWNVHAYPI